jgi:hypothetical protein
MESILRTFLVLEAANLFNAFAKARVGQFLFWPVRTVSSVQLYKPNQTSAWFLEPESEHSLISRTKTKTFFSRTGPWVLFLF